MESNKKISEEKIQKIIAIYKTNPTVKYADVMKEVGVSSTVIKRVRRDNNLMHLGYKRLIGRNNKVYKNNNHLEIDENSQYVSNNVGAN